jgi:predicted nucleotide-binding protein
LQDRIKLGKEIQESFSVTPRPLVDPLVPKRDASAYMRDAIKWSEFNSTLFKTVFTTNAIAKEYESAAFGMFLNSGNLHLFGEGVKAQLQKLESILERLPLYAEPSARPAAVTEAREVHDQSKVFVVHGHDEGAREAIARFIQAIGFQPIILHERANEGRTVIEKVEAHGDVDFAVVLLTPDDEGCVKGGTPGPRARQNVVLELGYFVGRLGRSRVCALKRGELEIPSDFGGVVYEPFDAAGGWKQKLGRELEAAGYEINWNAVMRSWMS